MRHLFLQQHLCSFTHINTKQSKQSFTADKENKHQSNFQGFRKLKNRRETSLLLRKLEVRKKLTSV